MAATHSCSGHDKVSWNTDRELMVSTLGGACVVAQRGDGYRVECLVCRPDVALEVWLQDLQKVA